MLIYLSPLEKEFRVPASLAYDQRWIGTAGTQVVSDVYGSSFSQGEKVGMRAGVPPSILS
jgi:hypothetical protein